MRTLCIGLLLFIWSVCSSAAPTTQLIQSCLNMEPAAKGVHYVDINPDSFNEEDDETGKTTSTTIIFHNKAVGMWKTADPKVFGLVYGHRKIPVNRVIKLGDDVPRAFNPYTAQWGEVRDARSSYVCITFNFEGLGESGSFQNIHGLYLIEANSTKPKIYYAVGDIRQ